MEKELADKMSEMSEKFVDMQKLVVEAIEKEKGVSVRLAEKFNSLNKEMAVVLKERDAARSQAEALLKERDVARTQAEALREKLDASSAQLAAVMRERDAAKGQVEELQAEMMNVMVVGDAGKTLKEAMQASLRVFERSVGDGNDDAGASSSSGVTEGSAERNRHSSSATPAKKSRGRGSR